MSNFRNWYVRNQDAITWFLIGVLTVTGLHELARGDYVWASISFAIAYANYKIRNFRMQ